MTRIHSPETVIVRKNGWNGQKILSDSVLSLCLLESRLSNGGNRASIDRLCVAVSQISEGQLLIDEVACDVKNLNRPFQPVAWTKLTSPNVLPAKLRTQSFTYLILDFPFNNQSRTICPHACHNRVILCDIAHL